MNRTLKRVFILAVAAGIFFCFHHAQAATLTAVSCAYDDVVTAIAAAGEGDTVLVPVGNCTWSAALKIQKSIVLQGAGIGKTTITSNYTTSSGFVIYQPANPHPDRRFRITGFTFNNGGKSAYLLHIYNSSATGEFIRIDHNRLEVLAGAGTMRAVYVTGTIFGVVDNNTVESASGVFGFSGTGSTQWQYVPRRYGMPENIYFEDNTATGNFLISGGSGGRFVLRYNSFTSSLAGLSGIFEQHGNQPGGAANVNGNTTGGNASTMVSEAYGNYFEKTYPGAIGNVFDQRGGWALMFFNKLKTNTTSASAMYAREEYADRLWPVNDGFVQHVTNSYYFANWNEKNNGSVLLPKNLNLSENCCQNTTSWQADHQFHTGSDIFCTKFTGDPNGHCWKLTPYHTGIPAAAPYHTGAVEPDWSSVQPRHTIYDGGLNGGVNWLNMGNGDTPLAENVHFWTQRSSGFFDGSGSSLAGGGVGCGTLADRPATCTAGVGYWATDQSCTDMTGMVGLSPATPISGTLYKCTDTNTWEPYYTPYPYPHPLRSGDDTTAPAAPAGFQVH